jgi:flagellin
VVSFSTYSPGVAIGTRALRDIDRSMATSQNRLATGLKVASSSDDPRIYAIASTIRSETTSANASRDQLGVSASKATVASFSLQAVGSILSMISSEVSSAIGASASSKASAQSRISLLKDQLREVVATASYGGSNWLDGSTTSVSAGGMTFSLAGMDLSDTSGTGILDKAGTAYTGASILMLDVTSLSDTDLGKVLTDVATAARSVSTAASRVGAIESAFDSQSDFLATIVGIKEQAVADLTQSDDEEELSRMVALETRRQYILDMLASVRESQRNILMLFDN